MENASKITKRIIKLPEVISQTGLSRSSIYAKIEANEFPKSIGLGARSVGWIEEEINQWIEDRINLSRS